mmetsp:Transcript_14790/g.39196  ORF Transcript_14790/g.39196 Transcript_14790/m.39196 type:complete len:214 (+) Transcript_14790:130-771(+)
MTAAIILLTRKGVSVSIRSVSTLSISPLTVSTSTISVRSKFCASVSIRSAPMPMSIGFSMGTIVSNPPNIGAIVWSSKPSGVAASFSSFLARSWSKLSPAIAFRSFDLTSTFSSKLPDLVERYSDRNFFSKNVSRIIVFKAPRMSLNRLGITPDPIKNGMRSNSILTASQFVTPPANPNNPKARMNPADAFLAPNEVRMMRPIISTTAVATLE